MMATQDSLSQSGCLLRIVLVGGEKVGCYTMIKQFINQGPGWAYREKEVAIDGIRVRLILFHWRHLSDGRSLMSLESWGKMLHAAVFVFDVTQHDSLGKMETYLIKLNHLSSRAKVIIGNKMDLLTDKVSPTLIEGKELAEKYSLPFYLTNALTGENVEHVFITLAAEALMNVSKEKLPSLYLTSRVRANSPTKRELDTNPPPEPDTQDDTILLTEKRERSRTFCCT